MSDRIVVSDEEFDRLVAWLDEPAVEPAPRLVEMARAHRARFTLRPDPRLVGNLEGSEKDKARVREALAADDD